MAAPDIHPLRYICAVAERLPFADAVFDVVVIGCLLAAHRGERNRLLFWASLRAGELVADGDLDSRTAALVLTGAATQIGLAGEDGPRAVAATIRSGFHRTGAAYEPP